MGKIAAACMVCGLAASETYGQGTAAGSDSCKALARLELKEAKIISAETVAAGAFVPPSSLTPGNSGDARAYKTLPAFCRVVVEARPSADSDIGIEVWMPAKTWNGRFRGQGNGGFAGAIDFRPLGAALGQGYATAGTDTGHSAGLLDARWALGHPEKVTDFGYRGIHSMTVVAKAAIKAFYGRNPGHSYFGACSNGGRQALMEAQRFPDDYDGILAGAPANPWTRLLTKGLADSQATTLDPKSYIPSAKLSAIAKAVNTACDAQDGVTDGVLSDPVRCTFDPASILCKEEESAACLTSEQAATLQKLYAGPRDSRGTLIFPGYVPGAEQGGEGWGLWITGSAPGKSLLFAFASGYFGNMVYEKAEWDYRAADLDQALKASEAKTATKLDATETKLTTFKERGGKLILYHGWNDPAISALSTISYYEGVMKSMGPRETDAFARLYLVPGMQHCGGGPGPNSFGQPGPLPGNDPRGNIFASLEEWVEKGKPPSAIIATKYVDDDVKKGVQSTRPLCPYPQIAQFNGHGDPKDAASFVCASRD